MSTEAAEPEFPDHEIGEGSIVTVRGVSFRAGVVVKFGDLDFDAHRTVIWRIHPHGARIGGLDGWATVRTSHRGVVDVFSVRLGWVTLMQLSDQELGQLKKVDGVHARLLDLALAVLK